MCFCVGEACICLARFSESVLVESVVKLGFVPFASSYLRCLVAVFCFFYVGLQCWHIWWLSLPASVPTREWSRAVWGWYKELPLSFWNSHGMIRWWDDHKPFIPIPGVRLFSRPVTSDPWDLNQHCPRAGLARHARHYKSGPNLITRRFPEASC